MAQPVMQKSFHAGEWAPALNARVDLAKYHSAARVLENFFVDYRGGASSRMGTKYVIQAFDSSKPVRLIPFAAGTSTQYVIEFGEAYARFMFNGAPVLETGIAITGATQANPCVLTITQSWVVGDVFFVSGIAGMTQLNGRFFQVSARNGTTVTLADLNGVAIDSTGYTAFSGNGTGARVYKIPTPYFAADLALLKFAQNVNTMVLCHPSYPTHILTLVSATNWTLAPAVYSATIPAPTGFTPSGTGGGQNFRHAVTAVDINGQESVASTLNYAMASTTTVTLTWNAVPGAQWYNLYRSPLSNTGVVPADVMCGFVGFTLGTTFVETLSGSQGVFDVMPDYSVTPPIARNPFQGGPVTSITVTGAGTYTSVPTVTIAAPSSGIQATGQVVLRGDFSLLVNAGSNYQVGDFLVDDSGTGLILLVTSIGVGGSIASVSQMSPGLLSAGSTPGNPRSLIYGSGQFQLGSGATVNMTWSVNAVNLTNGGSGYSSTSPPTVTFSSGAATATAQVDSPNFGNPSVPMFYNQRLVLAGPTGAPQSFFMSQPAQPFNFNISNPTQATDAITGALVSKTLNTIKSLVPMPTGLIIFSDQSAWLINGGSAGTPASAIDIAANSQAYNGASDVPPIVANFDILYVQAKGSIVRDLTYNFYTNVFTGTDISVLSSHLFYGYNILEWAYCEEPFKIVWAVRNDGVMLSLTFLKEQELIGWTHHVTEGLYKSVCSVVEDTDSMGLVDALYCVVERVVNGNTVQYIERMAERIFPNGKEDAICVDAAISYDGAPATNFQGAEHLAGMTVTGLADGNVITPFVMPVTGFFTLPSAASVVHVGMAFEPRLQTLPIDLGEPTVQGKMKKIPAVTVRVQETLGISMGSTFDTVLPINDFVEGQVNREMNEVVQGLFTGDGKQVVDPMWTTPGQYCITQPNPYPVTILGVIPEVTVGDTAK